MPYDYRENEGRVFDYCVYRQGDAKPMQCFETAEEAQAYWMALTIAESADSQASASEINPKELAAFIKEQLKTKWR
jgi:dsDNA-binding SOS-regulon protein